MNTSLGKILLIFFICSSCATKKDLYYFQDIDNLSFENSYEYLKIQPGDILDIQIKAINPESVLIFQKLVVIFYISKHRMRASFAPH